MDTQDPSESELDAESRRQRLSIIAAVLIIVALHLIAPGFPTARLWGVNHLLFYPIPTRLILAGIACIVLIPRLNEVVARLLTRAWAWLHQGSAGRLFNRRHAVLAIVTGIILWFLRSRTLLLGDGFLVTMNVTQRFGFPWSAPLEHYLHVLAFALLSRLADVEPSATYAFISCLSGVAFVLVLTVLARQLTSAQEAQVLVFVAVLTMGSSQLFFGYVENYALVYTALLIYFVAAIHYLRSRRALFWVAAAFSTACTLHTSAVIFLPALLYLIVARLPGRPAPLHRRLLNLSLGLLAPIAILAFWFRLGGVHPLPSDIPARNLFFLPGLSTETLSNVTVVGHLIDVANEYLLVAPLALALLVAALSARPGRALFRGHLTRFLLLAALGHALFVLSTEPGLGMPRDWDIFAATSLPIVLLSVHLFLQTRPRAREVRYAAAVLLGAALVASTPWIALNANGERSAHRFSSLLALDPHHPLAAYGHEVLSIHYRERGLPEEEIEELERAAYLAPVNYRYHVNIARAQTRLGRRHEAETSLVRAAELAPLDFDVRLNLMCHFSDLGMYREASRELELASRLRPDDIDLYHDLGVLYEASEMYEEAIEAFERFIARTSDEAARQAVRHHVQQLYDMIESYEAIETP